MYAGSCEVLIVLIESGCMVATTLWHVLWFVAIPTSTLDHLTSQKAGGGSSLGTR